MAGITAAAIGAGAGILGDIMSSSGQSSANQLNMAMMMQNEQWQQQMSNTAVQRRKADLLAAGFNPMLATGEAASTPSVSQPTIQNPNAAYANLGPQISSAMAAGSQIKLQEAQANQADAQAAKTTSETPTKEGVRYDENGDPIKDSEGNVVVGPGGHELGDAAINNMRASTGVSIAQAQQVGANIDLIRKQTDVADFNAQLEKQDLKVQQATYQNILRLSNMSVQELQQELDINGPEAEAMKSSFAPYAAKARLLLGVGGQASGLGHSALSLGRRLIP